MPYGDAKLNVPVNVAPDRQNGGGVGTKGPADEAGDRETSSYLSLGAVVLLPNSPHGSGHPVDAAWATVPPRSSTRRHGHKSARRVPRIGTLCDARHTTTPSAARPPSFSSRSGARGPCHEPQRSPPIRGWWASGDLPAALASWLGSPRSRGVFMSMWRCRNRIASQCSHLVGGLPGLFVETFLTSLERDGREGVVARRGAALDLADVAQLRASVERTRPSRGDLHTGGAGGPEAAPDVEVVKRRRARC
jgi:hypothetical protein